MLMLATLIIVSIPLVLAITLAKKDTKLLTLSSIPVLLLSCAFTAMLSMLYLEPDTKSVNGGFSDWDFFPQNLLLGQMGFAVIAAIFIGAIISPVIKRNYPVLISLAISSLWPLFVLQQTFFQ